MGAATAVHAEMAVPKAVHRDPPAEVAQQLAHDAYMEAAWEHARVLMADLAAARAAASRRAVASLN